MIVRRLSFLVAWLLISVAAEAATQRALLIGVSNYEADLPPLAGARNDVMIISELLVLKFGFDRSNIRILVDKEATRANIFEAVGELSRQSAPEDVVLIHFSGHGSQAPDTNDDEDDGLDESILPYDSRTPGIADITDDEIGSLISKFGSRSVVVVLDSCHSGTGTRSGPTQVSQRWVAPDTRKELYATVHTRQVLTLPVSEKHVLFSAAQDSQSELDGPFGPNKMRLGLFTAALVGVLANAPPTISPREVIEGVNARIEILKPRAAGMPIPEPNMEAPLEKQELPMFALSDASTQSEPAEATAGFATGDRPELGPSRAIFVTADGVPQLALGREITESIGNEMVVADSVETADAVIDVVGRGIYDIYGPGGAVRIASGLTNIDAAGREGDYTFLRAVLSNASILADLVSLITPPSGIVFELKAAGVSPIRSQALSTRAIKITVNTANKRLRFYETGQPRTRENSLQLEARSSEDCYLTIATLNSAGQASLLFPNAGQERSGFIEQGLIRANKAVLVPDSLAPDNMAGFFFDYAPPGGIDRVIGICMIGLGDAEFLRDQLEELERGATISQHLLISGEYESNDRAPKPAPTRQRPARMEEQDLTFSFESASRSKRRTGWAASILTLEVGNY